MHDPRSNPGLATSYKTDATPGRHTQGGAWFEEVKYRPQGMPVEPISDKYTYTGKAATERTLRSYNHVMNSAGVCQFGTVCLHAKHLAEALEAVTGEAMTVEKIVSIGDRIGTLRTAFNLREGIRSEDIRLPGRIVGEPPLSQGPVKGVTVDHETQVQEYLAEVGCTPSGVPTQETLVSQGLNFVVADLYGGKRLR